MNKKISIIVPVYKVEKYLAKCLDSLVDQSFDDYEILVINDGSPENEQAIIDDYQSRYPDLVRSFHKENGGYGSVMELAIKESQAEYFVICDSDDYLDKDALKTLYAYTDDMTNDLVIGAKYLTYEDNEDVDYDKSFNEEYAHLKDHQIYVRGTENFDELYFAEPSPHAKLYRRSLVCDLSFPHKVSYTDNLLYFYALTKVHKVTYVPKALSYYLIDRTGNTRTDLKPTVIDAWVTVFKELLKQVNNADGIFYYRILEAIYTIFYKVEQIAGDKRIKDEKYALVYELIPLLFDKQATILKVAEKYDDPQILKNKRDLLDPLHSQKAYDHMVAVKTNRTFKTFMKKAVTENALLAQIYRIYHFFARYYKAQKRPKITNHPDVQPELINDPEGTGFFGYYDKPCYAYGHYLYHYTLSNSLSLNQEIKIMVDDHEVSTTNAWNWQQGSMASWFDERHIIHNYFDGEKYRSVKVNIETGEREAYCFPIYALSKDKTFALSLNFARLAKLRPDYGYFNLPYQKLPEDDQDGIYYLDLKKNEVTLWLSLKTIKEFASKPTMVDAEHKVNHIDISPNSKRAIFLHRWFHEGVKYTRLLGVDIATKKLYKLADYDMVSHMAFIDDDNLFGYLRGPRGDGFYKVDFNGQMKLLQHPLLQGDGHMTIIDPTYAIVDTYPDHTCMSHLYLVNIESAEVIELAVFYNGMKYRNTKRCDLHPRMDLDKKGLTLDSVAMGKKGVYHLDLKDLRKDKV